MNHKLKVSVSKEPPQDAVVTCKRAKVKNKLFKKLFGNSQRVTIIIPGDSIHDVTIREVDQVSRSGGTDNGK